MDILYSTKAHVTGGREGQAKTEDGRLELSLSTPKGLGGNDGPGTNPEQLFAAGYSACFIGAMKFVAGQEGKSLPEETSITGQVGIGPQDPGFGLDVELVISIPGMDRDEAAALVDRAHQVCPYSNATRGNVDVRLTLA